MWQWALGYISSYIFYIFLFAFQSRELKKGFSSNTAWQPNRSLNVEQQQLTGNVAMDTWIYLFLPTNRNRVHSQGVKLTETFERLPIIWHGGAQWAKDISRLVSPKTQTLPRCPKLAKGSCKTEEGRGGWWRGEKKIVFTTCKSKIFFCPGWFL